MVALWVPWHLGYLGLPSAFAPVAWHAHELLFGYVPAIIAGFLLTAVPNWTGRLPVVRWPLAGLLPLWLIGRIAIVFSAGLPPIGVALLSAAFPVALLTVLVREIAAGEDRRNAPPVLAVAVLLLAQGLFHYEAWHDVRPIFGARLAIAATLTLIMIVGGRIVPSFTRNWLDQHNPGALATPFNRFDRFVVPIGVVALAVWAVAPALPRFAPAIAALLALAGCLHLARQLRWQPHPLAEPLVTALHLGYAFVPMGFCSRPCLSGAAPVAPPQRSMRGRSAPSA
ncbi:MAG: NnrS family protein [Burkholderiaceae bacterium]